MADFAVICFLPVAALLYIGILFSRVLSANDKLDRLDRRFLEYGEGDYEERRRLVNALRSSRGMKPL